MRSIVLNWWVVVFFVTVGIMITLGVNQYQIQRVNHKRRVRRHFKNSVYGVVTGLSTALFAFLFVKESWRGVVQFLNNSLSASDSPAWSIILAPFAVLLVVTLYAMFVYYVGKLTGRIKFSTLVEELRPRDKK